MAQLRRHTPNSRQSKSLGEQKSFDGDFRVWQWIVNCLFLSQTSPRIRHWHIVLHRILQQKLVCKQKTFLVSVEEKRKARSPTITKRWTQWAAYFRTDPRNERGNKTRDNGGYKVAKVEIDQTQWQRVVGLPGWLCVKLWCRICEPAISITSLMHNRGALIMQGKTSDIKGTYIFHQSIGLTVWRRNTKPNAKCSLHHVFFPEFDPKNWPIAHSVSMSNILFYWSLKL